ncbi:MAG TPA: carbohydrate porin [Bryobacteraceae bacterium]|nr:carbohydrate porin [Bryobacteraceae bacterium]
MKLATQTDAGASADTLQKALKLNDLHGISRQRSFQSLWHVGIVVIASLFGCGQVVLAADPGPTTVATSTVTAGSVTIPTTQPTSIATQNAATGTEQLWNLHFQSTAIVQGYPAFPANYSGHNSLPDGGETRETVSVDVMGGLRLWSGAEAHIDGLMWQGYGIGNTLGAEGFPSGEAYRLGTQVPNGTIARLFIRQTIGLGGDEEDVTDGPLTLAGKQDVSRLTFTLGRLSAADIFDTNAYANDPRTQFMNWGLVNNEAWDYPADSIGYDTGLAIELNQPNWTLRYGFFQVPSVQNGLNAEDRFLTWPYNSPTEGPANDGPLSEAWGMVMELERRYSAGTHPGTIRFLAYVNRANMASYSAATAILKASGPGADISAATAFRCKYGFGLNWEQEIADNIGIFSRVGWNDAQEQGWMFSDVAYTGSLGLSIKGAAWHRPDDTLGIAGLINGASHVEQEFFQAGGLGILAGDGQLSYAPEEILETYYSCKITEGVFISPDYQFIDHPAFNHDRGPVSVFSVRFHWEM